jgi:plasmid stability protein
MSTTLTVRTDEHIREALRQRAAAQGKTISVVVREILEEALSERPIGVRAGHLKGRLDVPANDEDPWRRQLRERNWRP